MPARVPAELSKEELTVVLAMRQDSRAGRAIYRYALSFDQYDEVDTGAPPFTLDDPDAELSEV